LIGDTSFGSIVFREPDVILSLRPRAGENQKTWSRLDVERRRCFFHLSLTQLGNLSHTSITIRRLLLGLCGSRRFKTLWLTCQSLPSTEVHFPTVDVTQPVRLTPTFSLSPPIDRIFSYFLLVYHLAPFDTRSRLHC
jgi:hypothetical protein